MKIKKILAVTMAVVMLVSGLSITAFASETQKPATYNYVALGDSIASGYGLTDKGEGEIDPALILSDGLIANPIDGAYPALFGDFVAELGEKYGCQTTTANLSSTAYRATDVAETITTAGTKGEVAAWILETFVGEGTSEVLLNYHDIYTKYLADADLVSIGLGGNDVIMAAIYPMVQADNPVLTSIAVSVALVLFGYDVEQAAGAGVMLLMQHKDELTVQDFTEAADFISAIPDQIDGFVADSAESVGDVVDAVRTVNTDADIAVIGMYNPYGNSLRYDGQVRNICNVTKNIFTRALDLLCNTNTEAEDVDQLTAGELEDKTEEVSDLVSDIDETTGSSYALDPFVMQMLSIVAEEVAYPLQYALIGERIAPSIKDLNKQLCGMAMEKHCAYVDTYFISNECNLDPHPTAEGHQEIAEILSASLYGLVSYRMSGSTGNPCGYGRYCYGDVDKDGDINNIDTALTQRQLAKMRRFSALQMYLADTDCDNEMSIMDVTTTQMYLAEFPCQNRINAPFCCAYNH